VLRGSALSARLETGADLELEVVPGRDRVDLAALLAEAEAPLRPVRVRVAELEPGVGAGVDVGGGQDHEQRLVEQADDVGGVDGRKEVLDLVLDQDGDFPSWMRLLGPHRAAVGLTIRWSKKVLEMPPAEFHGYP
jgi:hypothetical protein